MHASHPGTEAGRTPHEGARPLKSVKPRITAFVLTGGGSLGAVQVGMLRALTVHGVRPDFLVGVSVGAINAAYFANEPSLECVECLETIWREIRRGDVLPVGVSSAIRRLLWHRDRIADATPLQRLLERELPYERIEQARIPLHILATDLRDGTSTLLSRGTVVPAVIASAAIPGVFPPVLIGDRVLVDGGGGLDSPLAAANALGATRIVVLPTGYTCKLSAPPRTAGAIVMHSLSMLFWARLLADVERFRGGCEILLVPRLCPLSVAPYDFSQSEYLIERAAESTATWLEGDGRTLLSTQPSRADGRMLPREIESRDIRRSVDVESSAAKGNPRDVIQPTSHPRSGAPATGELH